MIPHLCLCSLCFLQSCNKSLINQACSGPYWENIGPRSFLYGPRSARSVLSRPRADILPVRPSRLVNKIYVFLMSVCKFALHLLEESLSLAITLEILLLHLIFSTSHDLWLQNAAYYNSTLWPLLSGHLLSGHPPLSGHFPKSRFICQ